MEQDPMKFPVPAGQLFGQMPGDGFPFAVRVGGQINMANFFGRLFQLFQDPVFSGNNLKFRFELIFYIDSKQFGG